MKQKPFEGPKLKVSRAKKHIADLEAEIAQYLSRDPSVIFLEYNRETRQHNLVLRSKEGIPDTFTTIFGDAIHNLRTALDLLANDLVALSGTQPKKVYFPFADSEAGLEDEIKRKMRGATSEILDLIRCLGPYRGGNLALRGLHDLDITDKHINLFEAAVGVSTPSLPFKRVAGDKPTSMKFEADFGALPTVPFDNAGYCGAGNEKFENRGRLVGGDIQLNLGKGLPFEGRPALAVLHHLAKIVEATIQMFETHCLGEKKAGP